MPLNWYSPIEYGAYLIWKKIVSYCSHYAIPGRWKPNSVLCAALSDRNDLATLREQWTVTIVQVPEDNVGFIRKGPRKIILNVGIADCTSGGDNSFQISFLVVIPVINQMGLMPLPDNKLLKIVSLLCWFRPLSCAEYQHLLRQNYRCRKRKTGSMEVLQSLPRCSVGIIIFMVGFFRGRYYPLSLPMIPR